jgi:hypothetical protein
MNQFESSAKSRSERESDVRRLSEFHTVFLSVAGQHDLHRPIEYRFSKNRPELA